MDSYLVSVDWILKNYVPGSHDWTWDEEELDLLTFDCVCATGTPGTTPWANCDTPGHYQLNLETYLKAQGRVEQPILLGSDGRIWDGHHRLVAARRLGFEIIPVESESWVGVKS